MFRKNTPTLGNISVFLPKSSGAVTLAIFLGTGIADVSFSLFISRSPGAYIGKVLENVFFFSGIIIPDVEGALQGTTGKHPDICGMNKLWGLGKLDGREDSEPGSGELQPGDFKDSRPELSSESSVVVISEDF